MWIKIDGVPVELTAAEFEALQRMRREYAREAPIRKAKAIAAMMKTPEPITVQEPKRCPLKHV